MSIADYNSVDKLPSYQEVVESLKTKKRTKHLLLGNGFSRAYEDKIFSYNALARFVEDLDDPLLRNLFEVINTKNFELVMQQLDSLADVARVFGAEQDLIDRITAASEQLKTSLIDAVKALHPEHVFEVAQKKSRNCAEFVSAYLENYGLIFTTNYDLLLYWVLMRNELPNVDGFGRELLNPGEWDETQEWSELRWGKHSDKQSVFYVHGALHLFDTGTEIEKEVYENEEYLLTRIKERIDNKDYPIFVTAGSAQQKMAHIRHNLYLSFCYDALETITGSLIVFGFGFGEYDTHIIDAINEAANHGRLPSEGEDKLWSIYVGVFSDRSLSHLKEIEHMFQLKVNAFDARTACIWE
jgi:hypothetical protein